MSQENNDYKMYVGGNRVKLPDVDYPDSEEALKRERLKQYGRFAKEHIWSDEEWELARRYFDRLSESELLVNSNLVMKYLNNHREEMITNSLWEPEIPSEEIVMRRYLKFDYFLQLVANEYLWFSRSDIFKDKYEGAFPTPHIEKQKEIDQTRMEEVGIPEEDIEWEDSARQSMVERSNKSTYVNCWRRGVDESSVFWDAYIGDELGVAVETTVNDFRESIDIDVSSGHIDLMRKKSRMKLKSRSKYIGGNLEEDIISELSKLQIGNVEYINYKQGSMPNSEFSRFFHKRNAFSDEMEFRALFRNSSYKPGGKASDLGVRVSIEPKQMIRKIWLKPRSPDWFENLVCGIVEKFGIDQELVNVSKIDDSKHDQEKAIPGEYYSLMLPGK